MRHREFSTSNLPICRDRLRQVIAEGIEAECLLQGHSAQLLIDTDNGRIAPPLRPIGPQTAQADEARRAMIATRDLARRCCRYADATGVRIEGMEHFLPNPNWQGFGQFEGN